MREYCICNIQKNIQSYIKLQMKNVCIKINILLSFSFNISMMYITKESKNTNQSMLSSLLNKESTTKQENVLCVMKNLAFTCVVQMAGEQLCS